MIDLERQLMDYGEFHDEEWGPISPEDILATRVGHGPIKIVQARQPKHRPQGLRIAVAAAAVVLVLLGGVALLFQVSESGRPVAGSSVDTTLTESVPTTAAESSPITTSGCLAPSMWTRVCDDAAGFEGALMLSVTSGGPGLVAVGSDYDNDNYKNRSWVDAVVWTSPDGFTWSRVPHDESVFGGAGLQRMLSVTAGVPGLVAVGMANGDAAVWTSLDGFTWSRVPHDEATFGGDGNQQMLSVTLGGPGLVAVGSDGGDAAVWTSLDGFTWSRVPHDEAIFGGDRGQKMRSVIAGGPGLVAVGGDGTLDEDAADWTSSAAAWTSSDGFTWTRVPDESIVGGSGGEGMFSVAAGGPGLVAVGSMNGVFNDHAPLRDMDAAVWTSLDGFTWTRVPHDPSVFALSGDGTSSGHEQMGSVTAGGPGLVAVGSTGVPETGWDEAVWTSRDGFTWTLLPQSPDNNDCTEGYDEMTGVTFGSFGLMAVGYVNGCNTGAAAVWHD
jgi:hypothetical protein